MAADDPPPPPPFRPGRPAGHGAIYDIRRASGMHLAERIQVQTQRDALVHALHELDDAIATLAAERRQIVTQLAHVRDRLYPPIPWCHGRRPPDLDTAPLPPVPDAAEPLSGRALRAACRAILERHGTTNLVELHGLLHRYGYLVSSRRPVAALSDALRYEVRVGRVRRVERGVYELRRDQPRRRRPTPQLELDAAELLKAWVSSGRTPLDPTLDEDPGSWGADGDPDKAVTNLASHDPP